MQCCLLSPITCTAYAQPVAFTRKVPRSCSRQSVLRIIPLPFQAPMKPHWEIGIHFLIDPCQLSPGLSMLENAFCLGVSHAAS